MSFPHVLLCVCLLSMVCITSISAYSQNNSEVELDFHVTWLSDEVNNSEAELLMIGGQDYIGLKYSQVQLYLGYLPWSFEAINTTTPEGGQITQNILVLKTGDDGGSMLSYSLLGALLIGILVFFLVKVT